MYDALVSSLRSRAIRHERDRPQREAVAIISAVSYLHEHAVSKVCSRMLALSDGCCCPLMIYLKKTTAALSHSMRMALPVASTMVIFPMADPFAVSLTQRTVRR